MLNYIIPFLVLFFVVTFVHEYGHYYFAKRYGVKVDVFSIGIGKELFGWTDKMVLGGKFAQYLYFVM